MCAPTSSINMNSSLPGASKDALFFNANKFVGGLQAPCVLVYKKSLLRNAGRPHVGTKNIIGAVRVGLVVQLKESIGLHAITLKHEKMCK